MRNNITGIVETAAIDVGIAVKKGSAANGIVKCGAGEKSLGLVDATDFNHSVAVGEQASISVDGLGLAVVGVSVVAMGTNVESDTNGKVKPIAGSGKHQRVGETLEPGNPGDLVKIRITLDEVNV
jgi:hypothetical protein